MMIEPREAGNVRLIEICAHLMHSSAFGAGG